MPAAAMAGEVHDHRREARRPTASGGVGNERAEPPAARAVRRLRAWPV